MRICKTLGEDSQGFVRLWERICKTHKTLGEYSQGFVRLWERIHKDLQDSGRVFTRIHIGKGFMRICQDLQGFDETLGEYSQGFMRIRKDSQGFVRLWERICKDL